MSDSTEGTEPQKRKYFQWDAGVFTLGSLIAVILVVYFSIYLPNFAPAIPWPAFVVVGWLLWVQWFVLFPKFVVAVLGERTGILATMEGTWRISEATAHELPPLTASIDLVELKSAGVRIPPDIQKMIDDNKLPTPGKNEKGHEIRAWYYKTGGYRYSEVWYLEPGRDGFHITIGFKFIDLGGARRGGCLVSPCVPIAVSHEVLPEQWLEVLRNDHMWRPDVPVYLHVEPSPGFLKDGILAMSDFWKPHINGEDATSWGRLSYGSAYALTLSAEGRANRWHALYDELWDRTLHQSKELKGNAEQRASAFGRPDRRGANYRAGDDVSREPVQS